MWLRAVHRGHVNQMVFVLEVVRFIADSEEGRAKGVTLEHVGYMRAIFKTKMDAASYYDRHNHHMRCLNAHKTWCSDWDPSTRLKYIPFVKHPSKMLILNSHLLYPSKLPV